MYNPYECYPVQLRKVQRMQQELSALGIEVQTLPNDGTFVYLRNGGVHCDLQADFVLYLDKERIVPRLLERCGLRVFNSAAATEICDDKLLTHAFLADSGIPMPDTIVGPLCYNPDAQVSDGYIRSVVRALGLPMVVKECHGSFGEQVYLCQTERQLADLLQRLKHKPYLLQRYEKDSFGRDMRVIVIGGKVLCGMLRTNKDDFRSNAAQGAVCSAVTVPKHIADMCVKAANLIGLDYCGVDVLLGEEPKLCEVNSNAAFEAMEACTGVNVAQAYARHIAKCMQQK